MSDMNTQLASQVETLSGILHRREGILADRLPDAVDNQIASEDRDIQGQYLTGLSYKLKDTIRAKEKLTEGTQACCDDCDGEITEKRRDSVPEAVRCTKCQDVVDQRRSNISKPAPYRLRRL
jgi:RNA polymerase-binding transcription factor DksA